MNSFQDLRVDRDDRDVVTVTFDVAHRPVNVFDESLLRELSQVVDELEMDRTSRMVVFRSAKPSGFMAGADLHVIENITTPEEVDRMLAWGHTLFRRIETLPMPTLCLIHGACLGGGLEFALACRYRIARDDSSTRLGLPETQLGLLPGWGGTQRLPAVVGVTAAARLILEGTRLTARQAEQAGLVDVAWPPATFEESVANFISDRLYHHPLRPRARGWMDRLRDNTALGRRLVLWWTERQLTEKAQHYPALSAALRAIEAGVLHGRQAGFAKEREEFAKVLFHPACRNLLDLFGQGERARNRTTWVPDHVEHSPPIKSIAVLGAGTMGAGIAQLAVTQGYSVTLMDIDTATVQQGLQKIEQLTQQAVKKEVLTSSDAERALASIQTATRIDTLPQVDLVVEAVVERIGVKRQVFHDLDAQLPMNVLLASNTSALPIHEMAAQTHREDRVAGLHFFNPVHKMPLVEIVRTAHTSDDTIAALVQVVRKLGKTPLVVAEGPGFLVNRILFPYLDEAVRMVCEGLSADQIDREAKRFGLPMGPLELMDTIGLDVAVDVSRTLSGLSHESSPTPSRLAEMVAAGEKGQKTGRGFYTYHNGRRDAPTVHPIAAHIKPVLPPTRVFAGESVSGIQQRLVFTLINAAVDCLQAGIVSEPWMIDLGMVLGTGFPPFRGGPLKLRDAWGHAAVQETLKQLRQQCGARFEPTEVDVPVDMQTIGSSAV
jgi:3-hydroxyacyl-CoA dehydrogenase / enoyl-CoA hydratase / 3-hydroxybutyryl-CoA epimerase